MADPPPGLDPGRPGAGGGGTPDPRAGGAVTFLAGVALGFGVGVVVAVIALGLIAGRLRP